MLLLVELYFLDQLGLEGLHALDATLLHHDHLVQLLELFTLLYSLNTPCSHYLVYVRRERHPLFRRPAGKVTVETIPVGQSLFQASEVLEVVCEALLD